jgi:phosphoserine aminotransferase
MCLKVVDEDFIRLPAGDRQAAINAMVARLEQEGAAYDIGNYRAAPPGFRLWGGATVETADLEALTPWLDWAFAEYQLSPQEKHDG